MVIVSIKKGLKGKARRTAISQALKRKIGGGVTKVQARFRGARARRSRPPSRRKFELKLLGTTDVNPDNIAGTPVVAPNNGDVYWKGYCLTDVPSAWTSGLVNLSGMNPAQGVTGNTRIGDYVYFRRTAIQMEIATQFSSSGKPPLQFRVVVAKALQSHVPAGSTDAPGNTLFLDNIGNAQGVLTTGSSAMTSFEYHNNLINKRDWIVYRDQKFTLSHPARSDSDGGYIGYSGKYPIKKNFRFNLNHFKKTRIGGANLPQDYDGHYLIMIFASNATADSGTPDQWKITMRGTTSYTDN